MGRPVVFVPGTPNELRELGDPPLDPLDLLCLGQAEWEKRVAQILTVPGTTTARAIGFASAGTFDGTLTALETDSKGHLLVHTGAASTNSDAGVTGPSYAETRALWTPDFSMLVRPGASLANQVLWVGLVDSSVDGVTNPAAHQLAAFCYRSATDANWKTVTSDGTTAEIHDGPAIAAGTSYRLRVALCPDGAWRFWVNGVLAASHTVNLPASATGLGPVARVRTLENVAKSIAWGRLALIQA
jgi:hypothetical protein